MPQPRALPFIIANEAAERFSYYGMKCILVVYMTQYLVLSGGAVGISDAQATIWYHTFSMGNYLFPIFGAILSDMFWGKFKTIVVLSTVYCLGHLALAVQPGQSGLMLGLSLIAIGAGGIKPCVSAHLGDQYETQETTLLSRGFAYFYLAINVGATLSTLATPLVLERKGPEFAFALPGILMVVATLAFVAGRGRYRVAPPIGVRALVAQFTQPGIGKLVTHLAIFYAIISVFWALYDQTGSSWVLQAQRLDRHIHVPFFGEFEISAAQVQALNPICIVVLTPVMVSWVYPILARFFSLTAPLRVGAGMLLAATSFCVIAWIEMSLDAGSHPSIMWQGVAYVIMTVAEILVSITALEYAYTQAPAALKSIVTSLYLVSVALGNFLTTLITWLTIDHTGKPSLSQPSYFLLFASLSTAAAILLLYRGYSRTATTMNTRTPGEKR